MIRPRRLAALLLCAALSGPLAACSPAAIQVAPAAPAVGSPPPAPPAAAAAARPAGPPAQYKKQTTYDFKDDVVEGKMLRPDGHLLEAKRNASSADPSGGSRAEQRQRFDELRKKKEELEKRLRSSTLEPGGVTLEPARR